MTNIQSNVIENKIWNNIVLLIDNCLFPTDRMSCMLTTRCQWNTYSNACWLYHLVVGIAPVLGITSIDVHYFIAHEPCSNRPCWTCYSTVPSYSTYKTFGSLFTMAAGVAPGFADSTCDCCLNKQVCITLYNIEALCWKCWICHIQKGHIWTTYIRNSTIKLNKKH